MSRYRKIEVRTWSDESFRELSPLQPSGQALWFYLLTGPQTGPIPGLYRAGRAAMAEELEWPLDAFYDKFTELEARSMAKADWKARLVWLPNAIKHNKPESPNVVRSWRTELDLLPECALKREAIAHLRQALADMGPSYLQAFAEALGGAAPAPASKPFLEALPEAFPEGLPESGTGTGTGTVNTPPPPAAPPDPAAPPTPAGVGGELVNAAQLATVLQAFGINAGSGQPQLVALAAQGITPETVKAACEEAKRTRPKDSISIGYVLGVLRRWKAEADKLDLAGTGAPKPAAGAWWATDHAILAKGAELALAPRAGETMQVFKGRIQAKLDNPASLPPPGNRSVAPPPIEPRGQKPLGLDLKALVRQAAPQAA
jgi:hypothetical protein